MENLKTIITGFARAKDSASHWVVFTATRQHDDFTGLDKEIKRAYICVNDYSFKDFIHQEVILTLAKSPVLNKLVCVSIKKGESNGK